MLSLWLALLLGAWGAALAMAGALTARVDLSASGERGVHAATVFTALAVGGLGWALAVGDLTYRYVATWASYNMALPYRLGAIWAGPSGALLLWILLLGAGTTLAAALLPRAGSLRAWTVALLALMLVALLGMVCFSESPFLRLAFPPDDGRGVPLEWMRPVVLLQMPIGYVGMTIAVIPAILTVMGAMGSTPWREAARRWALAAWAMLALAMLLDWRRRYGDADWALDWQWAPAHAGTAFAWAGAALLVLATSRNWRAPATIGAGFAAFTLALVGLAVRRSLGWDGVHDFAESAAGRAVAWTSLAAVVAVAVETVRAARGARGARAQWVAQGAAIVAAAALAASSTARSREIGVREGESARVSDRFGRSWTLSLEGVSKVGREEIISTVLAVRTARDGKSRGYLTAEVRSLYSRTSGQVLSETSLAGVSWGLLQDVRVEVRDVAATEAVLAVQFVPATTLLWIAALVAALAACAAMFTRSPDDPPEGLLSSTPDPEPAPLLAAAAAESE
ncbi:MAG: hypothetical protein HYV19_05420 [Gemmatimonadetes bacterium]|nr:hypothetical protein [Gemmatimonadota bacterium]